MPTMYLVEKLGYLAKSLEYLKAQDEVYTGDSELDWVLQNAESVIREIKVWRGEL